MEMKIISKNPEPLLSRIEVKAELSYEKETPSNAEVAKKIASELKKDDSLVVMKRIYSGFGSRQAEVDAVVYDSKEAKEKIEIKTKKQKEAEAKAAEEAAKKAEEEKAAAEAKATEEAKEESPAEEKTAPQPEEEKEEKPEESSSEEKKEEKSE